MSRLFSFGCSFTYHRWPSAADFVGLAFDEHYNYGQGGACNTFIMNRLMETDDIHHFNPDTDFIMIGITGVMRHSFLEVDNHWKTTGDIFPSNPAHPKNIRWFADNLFNAQQGIYDSWIAVKYILMFLETKKLRYFLYPAINNKVFTEIRERTPDMFTDRSMELLADLNSSFAIDSLEEFAEDFSGSSYEFGEERMIDRHPTMEAHLAYAKKHLPQFINTKTYQVMIEQLKLMNFASAASQSNSHHVNFIHKYRKV